MENLILWGKLKNDLLGFCFRWASLEFRWNRECWFYEKASLRFITRRNSWRINQAVALCFIWAKRKKQISVSSRLCDYSQRHLSCFRSRIMNSASSLSNWSLQPLFLDNALPSFISTTTFPPPTGEDISIISIIEDPLYWNFLSFFFVVCFCIIIFQIYFSSAFDIHLLSFFVISTCFFFYIQERKRTMEKKHLPVHHTKEISTRNFTSFFFCHIEYI